MCTWDIEKIHGGKTDEKEENFNVGMYGSIGSNSCYTSKCGKKNKQKTDSSIKSISGSKDRYWRSRIFGFLSGR